MSTTELDHEHSAHLEEYRLLISMLQHEEELFWRRNEIFIFVNGGLLTILGLSGSLQTKLPATNFSALIGVVGFIMCILWFVIVSRSESFYNLWHEQLEYLEEAHLAPIRIFTTSSEYFIKGQTTLGKKVLRLGYPAKIMRIYQALSIVMILFMAVWLVTLLSVIIR